jgi:outer membrane protein TolC
LLFPIEGPSKRLRGYVDLRAAQLKLGILYQASEVLRRSLDIVRERYQRGITNELDLVSCCCIVP